MTKKNKEKWGIWVLSQDAWLENKDRKPASYRLRRDAQKECEELNGMWRGRKKSYKVKRIP
tara:strand:+ start:292 stop:474 length:183 start_codon:yes stop_codon:yes gene_type:complete